VVYLAALVAFAAVIVATWLGSDDNNKPKPAVTKPHNGPTFRVVGNGGKCSLGTGRTFHFEGRGFTPGGKVIVLVFAPQNYRDPVYSNPYRFYWFHENFGVYQADANGEVHTKPWDCRKGPAGSEDPQGPYQARALDWPSGISSSLKSFSDVP
jgi:hypothetical protein